MCKNCINPEQYLLTHAPKLFEAVKNIADNATKETDKMKAAKRRQQKTGIKL